MLLVLVEGVDKCGKSSLLAELAKIFDAKIVKNTYKPVDTPASGVTVYQKYATAYTFASLIEQDGVLLFDRSHLTEYVYSQILRKSYSARESTQRLTEMLVEKAVVIRMTASTETIKDRFLSDGETFVKASQIDELQRCYDFLFEDLLLPNLTLSSDNDMVQNVMEAIQFINRFMRYEYKRN